MAAILTCQSPTYTQIHSAICDCPELAFLAHLKSGMPQYLGEIRLACKHGPELPGVAPPAQSASTRARPPRAKLDREKLDRSPGAVGTHGKRNEPIPQKSHLGADISTPPSQPQNRRSRAGIEGHSAGHSARFGHGACTGTGLPRVRRTARAR